MIAKSRGWRQTETSGPSSRRALSRRGEKNLLVSLADAGRTRYTTPMSIPCLIQRLWTGARMLAALSVVTGLCGCATVLFESTREARFIDMDGNILHVDYGKEKRSETLPNGIVCTFDMKVRIKLPEGKRLVLYQIMSTSGVRYASADKAYELIEKGPYCLVYHKGQMIFEGVFCRKAK
jgi:hypothetical protein